MANPITTLKNTPSNNTNLKVWLSVCLLLLSFIPGIYYMRFGVGFKDEAYQILNTLDWYNSPLAPLTGFFGSFLSHFTTDILAFRWLAMSLVWSATLLSGFYLYRRSGNAVATLLITASAIWMSGFNHLKGFLFGWDSFTYFTVTVVTISALEFLRTQKKGWLLSTAILSAICTLCRLPNIVCIFIIGGVILINSFNCKKKMLIIYAMTYILMSFILCSVTVLLMYGSLSNYYTELCDNTLAQHSVLGILLVYIHSFSNWIFPFTAVLGAILYCINKYICIKGVRWWIKVSALIFILCVYIIYGLSHLDLIQGLNYIISALSLLGCIFVIDFTKKRLALIGLLLLCMLSIPCIGSNTGLIKIMPLCTIPLLFLFLRDKWNNAATLFYILFIMIYSGFSIYRKLSDNFEDVGMYHMSAEIKSGSMKGISTTVEMTEMINSAIRDVQPYIDHNYKVKVLGRCFERFGWELTFGDRNTSLRHWWAVDRSKVDVGGYSEYISGIANSNEPVLVFWVEGIDYRNIKEYDEYEDDVWEKDLLSKHMVKLSSTSIGYTLYTNSPLYHNVWTQESAKAI